MKTVNRADITDLQQIPNVGPSIAANLRLIGVSSPQDLLGRDPYTMYDDLCDTTGVRHDPCVIDVFIAAVRFMTWGIGQAMVEVHARTETNACGQSEMKTHKREYGLHMTSTDLETLKAIERNGVAHSVYWCHWPKMQLVDHPHAVVTESDLPCPFFNNVFSAAVPESGAESVVDELIGRFQSRSVPASGGRDR